jgi:Zn-dependent M28 family amino/carboxypeptidase
LIRGQTADEYVIVSAHLDHLGVGKPIDGDGIYNGAVDNATGCAGVIEIGRAFQSLSTKPKRSIILIATTAEEHGLLGARAYARNPAFPPGRTLAVINMDEMVNLKKRPEVFIGAEEISTLGELGKEIASDMGLEVNEAHVAGAERGLYNSDHGGFAEAGIPGILLLDDTKPMMETDEYMLNMHKDWSKRGHTPFDEYSDDWEMGNIHQLISMAFRYAYRLTVTDIWPEWIEELPFYYHPALPYQKIRKDSLNWSY